MPEVRGIVLHKILNKDPGYLEAWSKIKLGYFGVEYSSIYKAISKFYINRQDIPSFTELKLLTRSNLLLDTITALEQLEVPDVSLELAVDALINTYTQEETLNYIDGFLDELPVLDTNEIKDRLGEIVFSIEEKTIANEEIVDMASIQFVNDVEKLHLMPLGLNNEFDASIGGMAPTEVLAVGGMRGSGKSNICSNLCVNQYLENNTVLYFSIEMRAREVFNRIIAQLSGVPLSNITTATLSKEEIVAIAKTRAEMFEDADGVLGAFLEHQDYQKFEDELLHTKSLKEDNQIIIIDNQNLTLSSIDLTIQKFKAKFKDKLCLVVVDYLNQISVPDKYEWKTQIAISASLKAIARKYEIILVTPYQIDKTGEARFSKGILDSVDIAMNLSKEDNLITFKSTKTRNMKPFEFTSVIDPETLRIDPDDSKVPVAPSDEEDAEQATDIPW